jgi:hypothetical protein
VKQGPRPGGLLGEGRYRDGRFGCSTANLGHSIHQVIGLATASAWSAAGRGEGGSRIILGMKGAQPWSHDKMIAQRTSFVMVTT